MIRRIWRLTVFAVVLPTFGSPALAADMSAQMTALVSDAMRPYRVAPNAQQGGWPPQVASALNILRRENLLDLPRPQTGAQSIAEPYGKALMLGNRTQQFLPELATLHDALARSDVPMAKRAIIDVFGKAGRKPPEGDELEKLYVTVRELQRGEPGMERIEIDRQDYSIDMTIDHANGTIKVAVSGHEDPGGKPFRTLFDGEIVTQLDASGQDLDLVAKPGANARICTPDVSASLRDLLKGSWTDGQGHVWEVSGSGRAISMIEIYNNGHRVRYTGRYDLCSIRCEHIVDDPLDVTDPLPEWVKGQLAGQFKPPYELTLDANQGGDAIEGTWTSRVVTYDPMEMVVKSVHDPFDAPLRLTRRIEWVPGAADGARP